jgi:hypothetical protein
MANVLNSRKAEALGMNSDGSDFQSNLADIAWMHGAERRLKFLANLRIDVERVKPRVTERQITSGRIGGGHQLWSSNWRLLSTI